MARTKQTARKFASKRHYGGRGRGSTAEEEEKDAPPLTPEQIAKKERQRVAHEAKRAKQRAERQKEIDALPLLVPRPETLCEETANKAQFNTLVQQWTKLSVSDMSTQRKLRDPLVLSL